MSDDNDVWAVDDWVPADVKRRSTRALATVLTLTIIGGGLYLAGIVTIRSALGWPLFVSGLLVLVAVIVLVTAAVGSRRSPVPLPRFMRCRSRRRRDRGTRSCEVNAPHPSLTSNLPHTPKDKAPRAWYKQLTPPLSPLSLTL